MEALWILPAVILVVGLCLLVRAFLRLQAAMHEVRQGLAELAEMAPRIQRLGRDVTELAESIEEKRRQ
jgi:cytochrome c-type biogenesis protein CcmH/NrfF